MKAMVVGVLALASALVREREEALRDWSARAQESQSIVLPRVVDDDVGPGPTAGVARNGAAPGGAAASRTGDDTVVASGSVTSAEAPTSLSEPPGDESSDAGWPHGQWQIACEIKSGSALVFDRTSLREYGTVTLFRWSAPHTRVAGPGEQIFTAVVNCREKTIEAAWPGRSRATYAGTCGRGLVEAVCAASEQAAASPKPRAGGQLGAGHAGTSAMPRR
jgi:hypothetical protein